MVVLKEMIFNSFYIRSACGGFERDWFLIVSTFGRFGNLERTNF